MTRLRIVSLLSTLVLAASLGTSWVVRGQGPAVASHHVGLFFLLVLYAVAERFPTHLESESGVFTVTLYEFPMVAGLFLAPPWEAIVACAIGTAIVRASRRQSPAKLLFNTAMATSHVTVLILLFRLLVPDALPSDGRTIAIALGLIVSAAVANSLLVSAVIGFVAGKPERSVAFAAIAGSVATSLAVGSISLASVVILGLNPLATALLLIVVVFAGLGLHRMASLTQRNVGLRQLHDFATRLSGTSLVEDPMLGVLQHIRSVMRAETAEVTLLNRGEPHAYLLDGDGYRVGAPSIPSGHPVWAQLMLNAEVMWIVRGDAAGHADLLNSLEAKDLLVSPMIFGTELVGFAVARHRLNDVSTFSASDAALFETMMSHAVMTIENGTLVEQLKAEAAQRAFDATHDPLTGLANRSLFNDTIDELLVRRGRGIRAIMVTDLNRFKEINDSLGHHVGDRAIIDIARRLEATLPPGTMLARLGGDEFAILLDGMADRAAVEGMADAIVEEMKKPMIAGSVRLAMDIAVGIAIAPQHGTTRNELLKHADVAMYVAKEHRSSAWCVYSSEFARDTARQFALAVDLQQAIRSGELDVFYQPQIHLGTGRLVGFEALARWMHPGLGFVSPDEFIPIAERSGLIFDLTAHVLRRSLQDCATWQRAGIDATVSVNLSARASLDSNLPSLVASILTDCGLAASSLMLEMTEHELMSDAIATRHMLAALRATGVAVSIDDFGTGHSSLGYLATLPVDEIKIDRSFVMPMATSATDRIIVKTIVQLGTSMGKRVVAEGVENEELADLLRQFGCEIAQGYHFARPMPFTGLREWAIGRLEAVAV